MHFHCPSCLHASEMEAIELQRVRNWEGWEVEKIGIFTKTQRGKKKRINLL